MFFFKESIHTHAYVCVDNKPPHPVGLELVHFRFHDYHVLVGVVQHTRNGISSHLVIKYIKYAIR